MKKLSIASWNINSVRAHLPHLLNWLSRRNPDVLLLQEIKTMADTFPAKEIEEMGYNLLISGQKTYNGVAILSKYPIQLENKFLPGMDHDPQARYLEAIIETNPCVWRVINVYVPNGNPYPGDKFSYKLQWLEALRQYAQKILAFEENVVIGGDFNIVPTDDDVYDPVAWQDDALCRPESRQFFRSILNSGYSDALRLQTNEKKLYTFWDYQAGRWPRGEGLRIDHFLISPQAADRLQQVAIDKYTRAEEKPSDHVPIIAQFNNQETQGIE